MILFLINSIMQNNNLPSLFKGMYSANSTTIEWQSVADMIAGESLKNDTEKYRKMKECELDKDADAVKKRLPCITPAVECNGGRKKEHLVALTGVCMCDFDHVGNLEECFAKAIECEHTFLAYRTISGHGLRILFRVVHDDGSALPSPDKAGSMAPGFEEGNRLYAELLGEEYDKQCKNIGRLSVLCHDANAYFNPDASPIPIAPHAEKVKKNKSKASRLTKVVKAIKKQLDTEGIEYREGSYNMYVMRAGYLLNCYGIEKSQAEQWAVSTFNDYDSDQVRAIIASCYKQEDEFGCLSLNRKAPKDKQPYATVEQIEEFLASQGKFRYNMITRKTEAMLNHELGINNSDNNDNPTNSHPSSLIPHQAFSELTDRDVNSLWRSMSKQGFNVKVLHMVNVIQSSFVPLWNPFEDYFYSLPKWNGETDYIALVANMVRVKRHGAETQEEAQQRFVECLRKWLVAMVASLLDRNVVNNVILVLVGRQGIYKTTFFNHLLPPPLQQYFFTKTNSDRMTKDDKLSLAEFAIICLEELDSMKQVELNQLKALITTKTISERAAYDRFKSNRQHIASFCGTGNNIQFLTDDSGNRRWLPFEVENIDEPQPHKFHYTDLYSQATTLWQCGFRYWFNQHEIDTLAAYVSNFEQVCIEEELLLTYYRKPLPGEQCHELTCSNIIEKINMYIKKSLSANILAKVLRRNGFECRRSKKGTLYAVVELSGAEIATNKRKYISNDANE